MVLPVLSVVGPIFALILLGLAAVRIGYLPESAVSALGAFVLRLAMPALIFGALTNAPLDQTLDFGYLAAYGAASLAVLLFGYGRARLTGEDGTNAALQGLGMSASNSAFLGYPIAVLAVGPVAAATFAQNVLIETLIVLPLALILAEIGRAEGGADIRRTLAGLARNLSRNPLLVAMAAGLAVGLLGVPVPEPVMRPIDLLAGVSAPVALVVIGGTLATLPRGSTDRAIGWMAGGKLLLHPLAVLAAFSLVPDLDPILFATGLIFASAPMITLFPIIGAQYGEGNRCAAALTAATAASFLTLPLVLAALTASGALTLP